MFIAVLHPGRGVELVSSTNDVPPAEGELRGLFPRLATATESVPGLLDGTWVGIGLTLSDGSSVCALARGLRSSTRMILDTVGVPLLQRLAQELLQRSAEARELELRRLNATAGRIAASLDLDEVLDEIIRDATELLGADRGDIVLLDQATRRLRIVAVYGEDGAMGVEWSADKGLSARTMAARRTVVVRDYQRYRHRIEELAQYEVHAVLCAPLIAGAEAIGTITVHSCDRDYAFNAHHAQLLSAFANHAAVAIENARRYQAEVRLARELREANDQLARSLTLQQRLVEQVLGDRGIAGLVEQLATLLQTPAVVHDELLRTLAGASPDGSDDWARLALPGDGLANPALAAFLRQLSASRGPAEGPAPLDAGPPRLVTPVVHPARAVSGYLVLPWTGELSSLDRALIEVAITGVALEL
ncbi:MAG: GAF domain-containing protein, partial [Chloroflexi bacterium]|nr:GAF domain-containing protein [Chloroflexota bacterium]